METVIKSVLRLVQLLMVLLSTALIGNVIASNIDGSESGINFIMFVCVLSWIAVLYGIASHFVSALAIPIVALGHDAAASIFTLIGAIVLSAKLKAVNCANLHGHPSDYIAFGSNNDEKRCREIQATTVFLWFLWASFVGTLFFVIKEFRRGPGSVRTGPSMSQVGV
ncbi:marvel domain-containing protein [Xylariaceae sp. FL0662B]|nr:marvel domain-containing protein [Xylariaceae sp. FL0662B]